MDYKQLQDVIRSCKLCTQSIVDEYGVFLGDRPRQVYRWRQKTCKKCSSWLYNMDDKLLSYNVDPAYPQCVKPKGGKLTPQVITREYIEKGIAIVHEGLKLKKLKKTRQLTLCDIMVCVVTQLTKLLRMV